MRIPDRPDRVDGILLANRDLMVLRWLGEQYAARLDHLQTLIERSNVTAWTMVSRLRDRGFVETKRLLVGEPMWVFPTLAGLRVCGLPYGPSLPRSMRLTHLAAIDDVRLYIQGRSPETRWVSERQLLREGTFAGMRYVPDGVAIYEGRRLAIEVELSTRRRDQQVAKLDAHERRYDATIYFCAQRKPYRQLKALADTGRWPGLEVRDLPKPEASERG